MGGQACAGMRAIHAEVDGGDGRASMCVCDFVSPCFFL